MIDNQNIQINIEFYNEYSKVFIAQIVLNYQNDQIIQEEKELKQKLVLLEKREHNLKQKLMITQEKKKRIRRVANQIHRIFNCPVHRCHKSYGSEGSLNQHLKLKHYEVYEMMENN